MRETDLALRNRPYATLSRAKTMEVPISEYTKNRVSPVPYPIDTKSNPIIDGYYPGKYNMSGNILDIIPTSQKSAFIKSYDAMHMELAFRYMYLAMYDHDPNKAANIQFGKSINEAIAKVASDTFTELPFFSDSYTSSTMPTTDTKGVGEVLVWYQTMLQNMALPITTYRHLLDMEPYLLQMAYNRESTPLTELFGLFKKSSFKNYIKTFNMTIKANYFDMAWFRQVDTIANGIARKANDIRHPLLTITGTVEIPMIEARTSGGTMIFSSADYYADGVSFQTQINNICSAMSPYEVLKWARCMMEGTVDPNLNTAMAYFTMVKRQIETALSKLSKFQKDTADIRTMLDVAQRGNLNRWEMGIFFETKEDPKRICFNKIIADIYASYMATSFDLKWDDKTQSWTFKTPWSSTFGYPEYDCYNGGSFLTFSNHTIDLDGDTGLEQKYIIPIFYRTDVSTARVPITMIDREGREVELTRISRTLTTDKYLNRLNMLRDASFATISMPYASYPGYTTTGTLTEEELKALRASNIHYVLEEVFGYGAIGDKVLGIPDETNIVTETISSDIVGFVDVQITDVTNDLLVYYMTYAPLKVYTSDTSRTIGFAEKAPEIPVVKPRH